MEKELCFGNKAYHSDSKELVLNIQNKKEALVQSHLNLNVRLELFGAVLLDWSSISINKRSRAGNKSCNKKKSIGANY